MTSTAAIRAGRAYVELIANDAKLRAGLTSASNRLHAFGGVVRQVGVRVAAAGAAIFGGLAAMAGRAAMQFGRQMNMVSTMLSGADIGRMDAFSKGVRALSVEFGEATETLSKGLYDILSASIAPAQAMGVLAVAVKAAKGGMTDSAVAVDGLTSLLNSFGISADRAAEVSDKMFMTVKRGKITYEGLAANIGKVAPMARAAGMSMDDMLAGIATLTRQGLSAEEATTRLGAILRELPADAKDFLAVAQRFEGMELKDILPIVPEARAAGGLATLGADVKGLALDMDLMRRSAGEADEAFGKMTGGAGFQFARLKQALLDLAVTLGESLMPLVRPLVQDIVKVTRAVGEWAGKHPDLIKHIFRAGFGVTALAAAVAVLGTSLQWVSAGMNVYGAFQARAAKRALDQAAAQAVLQKAVISNVTVLGGYTAAQGAATAATTVSVVAVNGVAVAHTNAARAVAMHALAQRALQMQLGTTALAPVTAGLRTYTAAQLTAITATKLLPGPVKKTGGVLVWFSALLDAGAARSGRLFGLIGGAIKGAFIAIPGILAKVGAAIAAVFKGAVMVVGAILTPIGMAVASVAALAVGLGYAVLKARAAEKESRAIEGRSRGFASLSGEAASARGALKGARSADEQAAAAERLQKAYTDLAAMEREHQDEGFERRAQAYEKLAAEATTNLQTVQKQMEETSEAAQGLRDSIDGLVKDLMTEGATYGMSGRQAALYKLQMQGATDEQLRQATAMSRLLDRMDAAKAAKEKLAESEKEYQDAMFSAGKQIVDAVGTPAEKRAVRESELQRGGMNEQQARQVASAEAMSVRAQERVDRLRQAGEVDKQNGLEISELQLRAKYKGVELEQKLLELEHQRARAEAERLGGSLDLVDREYALRKQLAEQAEGGLKVTGSFSGNLVGQMAGVQQGTRIAKATELTAKAVQEQVELTRKGRGSLVYRP